MASNNIYQEERIPGQFQRFVQNYRKDSLAMFGLCCFCLLIICMCVAPWISPHDPFLGSPFILQPPSWDNEGTISHFLGTDAFGRDLLSRLLLGIKLTFGYGLLITFIAALIGGVIGVFAGVTKGALSRILHHSFDTVMAIPSVLLAIIFVVFLGIGEWQVLLAVGLSLIPRFIRPIYRTVSTEIKKDYNIATRLDGATSWQILRYSILPNLYIVIASEFTMATTIAILDITAFGFLTIGAQAPAPEWGAMMADSADLIYSAPWTVTLPGLFIVFSLITINLVGEGIHKALASKVD